MSAIDPFAAPKPFSLERQVYPDGFYQPIERFDFMRMLGAPFKSPGWLMNLIWLFLCELAAMIVVGRLVSFGYLSEVAEARSFGKSENWPDFNAERLSEYLLRGLWPFLWNLIWTIPLIFIVGLPMFLTISLSDLLFRNNNEVPGTIVAITGGLFSLALACLAILAMVASMMHSALGNDFLKGADARWIGSFISKVGVTAVGVGVLIGLTGIVVNILGLILFCVGVLLATPIMNMMAADAMAQLNDILVTRGGESSIGMRGNDLDVIEAQVVI